MRTLHVDYLVRQTEPSELSDPRGGRVINTSNAAELYNNLFVPYRGGDFQGKSLDPATKKPLSYLQTFPGVDMQHNSVALERFLAGVAARQSGLQGGNQQGFWSGLDVGVYSG